MNTLTIAGIEIYPIEINKGVKIDRRDITSEHEEEDPIIAQMAILACIKGDVVLIVSEDTDVTVASCIHGQKSFCAFLLKACCI